MTSDAAEQICRELEARGVRAAAVSREALRGLIDRAEAEGWSGERVRREFKALLHRTLVERTDETDKSAA